MDQERIGKFIAECRKKKNLTQEELAEKLGINSRSISRWENGNCMPDLAMLPLVSKELGVSINELMTGKYLDKDIYQDKFEENVVTTVSKVDIINKKYNKFMKVSISIIVVALLFLISLIFCNNYKYPIKYQDDSVEVNVFNTSSLDVKFYNPGIENDYIITKYVENNEEIGLIFVKTSNTIINEIAERHQKYITHDLTTTKSIYGNMIIDLDSSNIPSKFKIYYTTINFKELVDASNKKISKIISKSSFVYEGNYIRK